MYIHSYHIHNVLNVYRKHLSRESDAKKGQTASAGHNGDQVELTSSHRQSLIDQVSAEIVDRIAQGGSQRRFEDGINRQWRGTSGAGTGRDRASRKEAEFTYSTIDENNRKTTNTLPVENFSPLTGQVKLNTRENDG